MKKIAVIGGGPAGMMAAIKASENNQNIVYLYEKNKILGRKLLLTGGSRCNITNRKDIKHIIKEDVIGNGKFLYKALTLFGPEEIIDFLKLNGCDIIIEDNNRVFPKVQKSSEIIKIMENNLIKNNVKIYLNSAINNIDLEKAIIHVNEKKIQFDEIIIAAGGKTYAKTGSSGDFYPILNRQGVKITKLLPIEAALISQKPIKELQGVTLKNVELAVVSENSIVYKNTNSLLFTHFGLSGPAALRTSYYFHKYGFINSYLQIDSMPEISKEQWEQIILNDRKNNKNTLKKKMLEKLPARYIDYILEDYKTKLKDLNNISKKDIKNIIERIKEFRIAIESTKKFETAFVTAGGVCLSEINPQTMQLKKFPKVKIVGELLDIQGHTGGNNLTICLATGVIAGSN